MDIKKITVHGIKWQIGASLLQKIISFGTTIILARILGPSNYGLFALGLIIISAFGLFKSMGIETALIQRKADIKTAANTAFFIIPVLGLILYLLLLVFSPSIGRFLNNKELPQVIRILGLVFVFGSLSRVPLSLMEKEMKFKKVSIAETISALIFSIVAIVLAISGSGVWSLVYGYIASTATVTIMIFTFCRWKPTLEFDKKIAREMFNFGKFLFLAAALWFLKSNLDNLLVGKILGTTLLGFYAVAFNVANFGADYFGGKIHRVVYPAYSRLNADTNDLKNVFLKVFKYISTIAIPMGFGILIMGGDFLKLAYGEKWLEAIPVLKVLSLLAITNLMLVSIDGVLMALGKTKLIFISVALQVIMFFSFITAMAKSNGLVGVGIIVTTASCISLIFELFCLMKLLSLSLKEIFINIKSAITASLIMGIVIIALKKVIFANCYFKLSFVINLIAAISIYVFILFIKEKHILKEIKGVILS